MYVEFSRNFPGSTLNIALCRRAAQTQDKLFVATSANESGGVGTDRKSSLAASTAAAIGEVVGDDSMVVGKGIMIKGDVDNCAVRSHARDA